MYLPLQLDDVRVFGRIFLQQCGQFPAQGLDLLELLGRAVDLAGFLFQAFDFTLGTNDIRVIR
jgi:hypothetical protein